ncbi:protein translocase subunit SecF [Candidatus Peregrinibacteria bacterium]|nr:protein translocase subunit SecF [Candidatus Peregrinibacteria bacterium]
MFRSTASKIAIIVLFALALGYFDLPSKYKIIPGTPTSIKDAKVHLGLDLQGGSQLDYKVDLRKVPQKDQKTVVEGVKNVINRRVNGLGVSEPNIYTSVMGTEQHIVVELAGVKDLNEAKRIVGKTIQLEFKEKREKEDPEYKETMKKIAQSIFKNVSNTKKNFEAVGQEESFASPGKVKFFENDWKFASEITNKSIADKLENKETLTVVPEMLEGNDGYTVGENNQITPMEGYFIVKLLGRRDTSLLPKDEKSVEVSHILVSYRGADKSPETVTRNKEEAKQLAGELLGKLKAGEDFKKLAKENSDEPGAKDSAGKLPVSVKADGQYVEPFTNAALTLTKPGEFSEVTETPFGFHIIRADNFTQVKYSQIFVSTAPDPWQDTGLTGEQFDRADVTFDKFLRPTVSIKFNAAGAKLFEDITARNVDKPVAIFVGGNLISSPNVNEKISGGNAVISGKFTVDEAQALARDLNTGAIPAPVVLNGQSTIGATLGEEALQKSIKAGIVGFILLAIFMLLNYRLPGLVAILALTLYTAILFFLIKSELPLPFAISIGVLIFIVIINKILKSRDGGWEKLISFVLGCFILFFVTFLLSNAVVLTLAGIAGVILSIGMAVDANVLIFERTKEELRAGRPITSAVDVGFDRAWSSIRDSNFSSLITCAILFYFGTSIIQGFAFNLAAGILVSMFTAITITKTLLNAVMKANWGHNMWLWGLKNKAVEQQNPASVSQEIHEAPSKMYHIIEKTKMWFGFSGTVLVISLVAVIMFGLKLGLDFTGGTLLDFTFDNKVTVEELKAELKNLEKIINVGASTSKTTAASGTTLESGRQAISFDNSRIVTSPGTNQYMLHLEHIDNDTHDKIIAGLTAKFGALTENRFTTIGPVVGDTLKQKAVMAVLLAMAAIILYLAFAFRKVPKHVSPWKFGVCAIVALVHDIIIPIGVFAVFGLEVDALFITALLTVLGFSVHDTIVVFDRIRENLRFQERDETFAHTANKSMTQTMRRSINTSVTTLITLIALLIFGSASIFNFILVLVIGITVGTYSSIFIASPLLVLWQKKSGHV